MICELGQAKLLEDAGRDVDAALAVLADAGLDARTRQQHADLQGGALRAQDRRRGDERGCGGGAGGEAAARDALECENGLRSMSLSLSLVRRSAGLLLLFFGSAPTQCPACRRRGTAGGCQTSQYCKLLTWTIDVVNNYIRAMMRVTSTDGGWLAAGLQHGWNQRHDARRTP